MLPQFALVSGLGWMIDFTVFYALCRLSIPVTLANIAGASLAVLFVFFSSLRPIFLYGGNRTSAKLVQYLVYQLIAIPTASFAIGALSSVVSAPLVAKVLVTPITFACNFVFMRFLSRRDQ